MNVKTIGIDLAKNVFQIHGVDEHGKRLFNKQLRRAHLPSRADGQAKRPRSSRLVSRHSPSPVDHRSLT